LAVLVAKQEQETPQQDMQETPATHLMKKVEVTDFDRYEGKIV
jgi:hypothetical protein